MREEYEMDLELQLKRQASAHSMHLADELTNKESQITQIFNQRIQDQIDTLTSQYTDQLAKGTFFSSFQVFEKTQKNAMKSTIKSSSTRS